MRPTDTTLVRNVGTATENMRMGIDQSSVAHLMSVLTNLYSNPILAVIREYSTNALDSHIDAGNTAPIEVSLPSALDPHLKIQDRGLGLNVDDLRDVYSMYGASTKRDSDAVTGMLGLGCKAGLTYAQAFGVTAVKDGVQVTANVTKDHDGVGTIRILDTKGTKEPNGVLISIPVKQYDIVNFANQAKEFFSYWHPGTVLVDGEPPARVDDTNGVWLDEDVLVTNRGGSSKIIMGGVAYPFIPKGSLGLFPHSIIAWVPMGAVNFTPAREALHMTTRTEECIKELVKYATERLPVRLEEMMADFDTPFQKMELANTWAYSHVARNHPMWKSFLKYKILTPRAVWEWGYRGRARKIEDGLVPSQLVSQNGVYSKVITDFPVKILGAGHRERLDNFGATRCYVLPEGTDTSLLEGRPEVYTWDHVVKSTPKPKSEVRRERTKTIYTYIHNHRSHQAETLDPKDGPICWQGKQGHYNRSHQLPEAQIVELYAHQVKRFLRLHPTAVTIDEYFSSQQKAAVKALTADDLVFLGIKRLTFWIALGRATARIEDPQLAKVAKVASLGETPRIVRAKALSAISLAKADPISDKLMSQYPLLSQVGGDLGTLMEDVLLYINCKYRKTNPSKGDTQ